MSKKTILLLVSILFTLMILSSAYASTEPIGFLYNGRNGEKELKLGSSTDEIPYELNGGLYDSSMPFWSDPQKTTSYSAGLSSHQYVSYVNYNDISFDDVTLYYAYEFDENGYFSDRSAAKLYMIKLETNWPISESKFNSIISNNKKEYGTPSFTETTSNGILILNGKRQTSTTYHRNYTWKGADNTGIKISGDFEKWRGSYENVTIYIGLTNMDASFSAKKLVDKPAYMQVTTAGSISLKDGNGKQIKKLEKGSVLLVKEYDSSRGLFVVQYTDVTTSTKMGGGSFSMSSTSRELEGYISGDNLSVSKAELIDHFYQNKKNTTTEQKDQKPKQKIVVR